ncbi:MAG: hypothetical protein IKS98_12715 [Lachnospiraceae bacterium]|nr:hypothetical protein [Lachnospiraceae bacterium]
MKYSIDESMRRITARSRELIIKKQRRTVGFMAFYSVSVMVVAIAAIYSYAGLGISGMGSGGNSLSEYGAFMVPNEAGGYILVGLICFVAAVVITLLCLKINGRYTRKDSQKEYDNDVESANDIKKER